MESKSQLGRYRLEAKLGQGGMGEVWKAWDTELSRWVAIKILKSLDAEDVERFRREAQLAADLAHPNIAAIYEIGRTGERHWIAMQFIEGTTLRRGQEPIATRVGWVRDAARAVAHAHQKGIIHRDLKPQNLMLTGDRLFVMDFGLARRVEGGATLTGSGAIVGTPAYMSPEQARGDRTDRRTDIYGLGAVLYELIAGRPPFDGLSVIAVLKSVTDDDPRPPGGDPDLEAVVLKCLDKDPARRYGTAAAFADDLDRWLAGDSVEAKRPSSWRKLKRSVAKHRVLVAVGVACLAVGLTAALFLRGSDLRARQEAAVAELSAWTRQPSRDPAAIETEARRLLGEIRDPGLRALIHEAVNDDAAAIREASGAHLAWLRVRALAERLRRHKPPAPAELDEALQALGALEGDAAALAGALRDAVIEKRPEAAVSRLRDAHRASPSPHFARWIGVWTKDWTEKRDWMTKAIELAPFRGEFYGERGAAHNELQAFDAALSDYDRAAALGFRDPSLHVNRGYARLQRGFRRLANAAEADAEFKAAVEDEQAAIAMGIDAANVRFILGTAWMNLKEHARAVEELTRSLQFDPAYVQALVNRAACHRALRDTDSAVRDLMKAADIAPQWPEANLALGDCYEAMGSLTPAYRAYAEVVKTAPKDPRGYLRRGRVQAQLADGIVERDPAQARKTLAFAIDDLQSAARLAASDDAVFMLLGDMRRTLATWFLWAGLGDDAAVERVGALAAYDRVVDLAPSRADGTLWRGMLRLQHAAYLLGRGRQQEAQRLAMGAEEDYGAVIRARYQLEIAHQARAEVRRQMGRLEDALADAEEALKAARTVAGVLTRLAVLADLIQRGGDTAEWRRRAKEDLATLRGAALRPMEQKQVEDLAKRVE